MTTETLESMIRRISDGEDADHFDLAQQLSYGDRVCPLGCWIVLLRKRKALARLSVSSARNLFAVDADGRHALHYAAEQNGSSLVSAMKQHADFDEACGERDRHGMFPFDYGLTFGSRLARRLGAPTTDPDYSAVFETQAFLETRPTPTLRHPSNVLASLLYRWRIARIGRVYVGGHDEVDGELAAAVRAIRAQRGEIDEHSFSDFMFFESRELGSALVDTLTGRERGIVLREIDLYVEDDIDATAAYGKWLASRLLLS